jgi:hypothetical protein
MAKDFDTTEDSNRSATVLIRRRDGGLIGS